MQNDEQESLDIYLRQISTVPLLTVQEEIELALAGNYLTRVIYLEDPANPLPYQQA